jgi:hypothetical protein
MPTKAQEFRTTAARLAQAKKPKRAPRRPPAPVVHEVSPHESSLAGRRGGANLEATTATPSRKSTRGSSDHTKRTTNQQLLEVRRASAPSTRARQAKVRTPATAARKTSR